MKAFVFTMDAVLAIIPVIVVIAALSQGGILSHSNELQGKLMDKYRKASDVLETIYASGAVEELNQTRMESILNALLAGNNYSYTIHQGTKEVVRIERGNLSEAKDVVVARKPALTYISRVLNWTNELCYEDRGRGWQIYTMSFNTSDISLYDYWFVAELTGANVLDSNGDAVGTYLDYRTCEEIVPSSPTLPGEGDSLCEGDYWYVDNPSDPTVCKAKFYFGDWNPPGAPASWQSYTTYYTYIRLPGNRAGTFYIIQVPAGTPPEDVVPQIPPVKQKVIMTLKVWEEE